MLKKHNRNVCKLGETQLRVRAALGLWAVWALATVGLAQVLVPRAAEWQYHKGRSEASNPIAAWRARSFDAGNWSTGRAPFRYGDGNGGTVLGDMRYTYTTVFIRKEFNVKNADEIGNPELYVDYDDGFIMWINGVEVAQENGFSPPRFDSFSSGLHESGSFEVFSLPDPTTYLVSGVNVVAIQVFNTSLTSSDIMMNPEIRYSVPDLTPPTIVQVFPPEGTLQILSEITIVFSEPVTGIRAEDLLLNGVAARSVSGSEDRFTFLIGPSVLGEIFVTIAPDTMLSDFSRPANVFDPVGPGSSWRYRIVDEFPPTPILISPRPNTKVRSASEISVSFNEAVTGVDLLDLRVDGAPAASLTGSGSGPYTFVVEDLATGQHTVAWGSDHGIFDLADTPNAFEGGEWTFEVDPDFAYGGVRINELNAANRNGISAANGSAEDWIELYNPGNEVVDLSGWSLTDDSETRGKWVFSDTRIEAKSYLIIFCSGLDVRTGAELHTNFKLAATGEFLGLFSPDSPREVISKVTGGFPEQRNDYSYGLGGDGGWHYYSQPTPRAENRTPDVFGLLAAPSFSVERGLQDRQITIQLGSPDPGAKIRYTLDSSIPTVTSGFPYIQPIKLNRHSVVRAAAFQTGYLPSRVITHSYLFRLDNALKSLPIISLSTDQSNLWGKTGIMEVNPRNTIHRGIAWERPVSAEFIDPETGESVQLDCGIRIQGGDYIRGRYNPSGSLPFSKYSFRLYFRGDYGPGRLEHPLIPGSDIQSFDKIVLRAGMNDSRNPFVVDEIVRRLSKNMGNVSSRGGYANLFINGIYQGYYNPTERIDEDFLSDWHGASDDWDLIAQGSEVRSGDRVEWQRMLSAIRGRNMTNPATYRRVEELLDMVNFVDYILLNEFVATGDWPHNNWRAGRERVPGAKFRFYVWDAEWAMGNQGRNATVNVFQSELTRSAEISDIFNSLKRSPEFQLLFKDRVQKHMFNGGALTTDEVTKEYLWQRETLSLEIPQMGALDRNFIKPRRSYVITHLRSQGFWGSDTVPRFSQHGGVVPTGLELKMTALSGKVYYTTDGSDPRVRGSGQIALTAANAPRDGITITTGGVVKARTLTGNTWSALTEAKFTVERIGVPLRITEIMYNPPGGRSFEYIELSNVGDTPVDLSGLSLNGVDFAFAQGAVIGVGTSIVLSSNLDPDGFALRYPGVPVFDTFRGGLSNRVERLALLDPNGNVIESVDYRDDQGWPEAADRDGRSLERLDANGDPDDPLNWMASDDSAGSPGRPNGAATAPRARINEVQASNLSAVANGTSFPDWVEFYNDTDQTLDISGWGFTDDGAEPTRFVFPNGSSIAPRDEILLWCDDRVLDPGYHSGFGISEDGESLFLFDADGVLVDGVTFGRQVVDLTLAVVDGEWVLGSPTPLEPNRREQIGEPSSLIINEWMANPKPGSDDWIEVFNTNSQQAVSLNEVYFTSGERVFRISSPAFLGPRSYLRLWADEGIGPNHLDFKLKADGDSVAIVGTGGQELSQIGFGPQNEGVSQGRFPNGSSSIVTFTLTSSPGAENILVNRDDPELNEVMARDRTLGADWIELHNPSSAPFDLSGMSVSVDRINPGEWVFPQGMTLAAGKYLGVFCNGDLDPSFEQGDLNTGHSISGSNGAVYLFNKDERLVDAVEFGFQIPDQSIGLIGGRWRLLERATFESENSGLSAFGNVTGLKINEWLAGPTVGDDYFELYNPDEAPIALSGLFLTDDPSITSRTQFSIPPLTYIAPHEFVVWVADGNRSAGRDHVNFSLDAKGESIHLYRNISQLIDEANLSLQEQGMSQGLLPDGSATIVALAALTPGSSNAVDLAFADSDNDGMPDAWEDLYGLDSRDPGDANGDLDLDALDNLSEYIAGTHPNNPDSTISLSVEWNGSDAVLISFATVAGRSYLVESAEDPASGVWDLVMEADSVRKDGVITVEANFQIDIRFYRLRVLFSR